MLQGARDFYTSDKNKNIPENSTQPIIEVQKIVFLSILSSSKIDSLMSIYGLKKLSYRIRGD
jgi:hypothetical protein